MKKKNFRAKERVWDLNNLASNPFKGKKGGLARRPQEKKNIGKKELGPCGHRGGGKGGVERIKGPIEELRLPQKPRRKRLAFRKKGLVKRRKGGFARSEEKKGRSACLGTP